MSKEQIDFIAFTLPALVVVWVFTSGFVLFFCACASVLAKRLVAEWRSKP